MDRNELWRLLTTGDEFAAAQITALKAASLSTALASYGRLRQTAISGASRLAKISFGLDATGQGTLAKPTIAVTDDGSTGSASLELLDFPASSLILIDGCYANLSLASAPTTWAPTTPLASIGTAAAGANATLTSTEADVVPSTALTITSGASTLLTSANARAITGLTDSTGGATGDDTLAADTSPDLSGWTGSADPTSTQATAIGTFATAVKNDLADLAAKINAIISANGGVVPLLFSGTKKLFLNFAFNSDPSTGKTIVPTGDIWVWWRNLTP